MRKVLLSFRLLISWKGAEKHNGQKRAARATKRHGEGLLGRQSFSSSSVPDRDEESATSVFKQSQEARRRKGKGRPYLFSAQPDHSQIGCFEECFYRLCAPWGGGFSRTYIATFNTGSSSIGILFKHRSSAKGKFKNK